MMHINSLVSKLNLKDPWSAITHGIAMLLAIAGTVPLLLRAASGENAPLHIAALAVFIFSLQQARFIIPLILQKPLTVACVRWII